MFDSQFTYLTCAGKKNTELKFSPYNQVMLKRITIDETRTETIQKVEAVKEQLPPEK